MESLRIEGSKTEQYQTLLSSFSTLIDPSLPNNINLLNLFAVFKEQFDFLWIGLYYVKEDQLVLGPFQGPSACSYIGYNKGVCGKSWAQKTPILVEDVDAFPGHIACSSDSKSEIVLPAFKNGEVALILDVDSDLLNDFDEIDHQYLGQLMSMIEKLL